MGTSCWKGGGHITPCASGFLLPSSPGPIWLKHHVDDYESDEKNRAGAPEGLKEHEMPTTPPGAENKDALSLSSPCRMGLGWWCGQVAHELASLGLPVVHRSQSGMRTPMVRVCTRARTRHHASASVQPGPRHTWPRLTMRMRPSPRLPRALPAAHSPSSSRSPGTCGAGRPGTDAGSSG